MQNHGLQLEPKMSIRLRAEPRVYLAPGLRKESTERSAIDKNCGEIEKKYWTETRNGFTLNSELFA